MDSSVILQSKQIYVFWTQEKPPQNYIENLKWQLQIADFEVSYTVTVK